MNYYTTSLFKLSKFEQLDLLLHRMFARPFLSKSRMDDINGHRHG